MKNVQRRYTKSLVDCAAVVNAGNAPAAINHSALATALNEGETSVSNSEGPNRPFKTKTPLDGIMVMMTWYCGICKQHWKCMIDQGMVRRMPSYVKVKGQRVQTRRPDGSMLRAHEDCAKRMLKAMEDAQEREKKIIST